MSLDSQAVILLASTVVSGGLWSWILRGLRRHSEGKITDTVSAWFAKVMIAWNVAAAIMALAVLTGGI